MLHNISIGIKLPLVIVLISLVWILSAEAIATANARKTIMISGEDRLLAVAESRATEISREFDGILADLAGLAENPVILDASRAFVTSWHLHGPEVTRNLRRLYIDENPNPSERRAEFDVAGELFDPREVNHHICATLCLELLRQRLGPAQIELSVGFDRCRSHAAPIREKFRSDRIVKKTPVMPHRRVLAADPLKWRYELRNQTARARRSRCAAEPVNAA